MRSLFHRGLAGLTLAAVIAGAPLGALAQEAAPPAAEAPAVAEVAPSPTAEAAPADAGSEDAAPAAEETPTVDSGDTAWMLTATALVLLMTIPGLALFYGGMVRRKNVISLVAQCFAITCLMSVLWMVAGYSLAFSENPSGALQPYIGGLGNAFLNGVAFDGVSGSIPEYLFVVFQMTFFIITPALIVGAFAERMKFSAMLLFMGLWSLIVYAPVCHWVWGGGFLSDHGVLDFAGGTVVHINAGIAGLVCALVLGRRRGYGTENMAPNNLVLTMIGASLLWVGWFGFNAGSAVAANGLAAVAMLNTQVATAAAGLAWMAIEWIERKRPGMLGLASGAVAGLVAITPAAGFVDPQGALIIGVVGGGAAYFGAVWLKRLLKYDDSLDVFGVHGVAGIVGALLTGALASAAVAGEETAAGASVMAQLMGIVGTVAWCAIATFAILMICKFTVGLRVSDEAEVEGLDIALHGETLHEH